MGDNTLDGTSKTITPFLERCFSLRPDEEVRVSFSPPEMVSPCLWRCSYRMAWPRHELAHDAYGLDGVQALLLALESVHRSLMAEAAYREDISPSENEMSALTWMGRRDLGLPLPGTADTEALQAHLLEDARQDGSDLDQIILKECAVQYRKVARVAGTALNAMGARCRSAKLFGEMGNDEPDPLLETVLSRLSILIAAGVLEVQGDPSLPRYSEVRQISR